MLRLLIQFQIKSMSITFYEFINFLEIISLSVSCCHHEGKGRISNQPKKYPCSNFTLNAPFFPSSSSFSSSSVSWIPWHFRSNNCQFSIVIIQTSPFFPIIIIQAWISKCTLTSAQLKLCLCIWNSKKLSLSLVLSFIFEELGKKIEFPYH